MIDSPKLSYINLACLPGRSLDHQYHTQHTWKYLEWPHVFLPLETFFGTFHCWRLAQKPEIEIFKVLKSSSYHWFFIQNYNLWSILKSKSLHCFLNKNICINLILIEVASLLHNHHQLSHLHSYNLDSCNHTCRFIITAAPAIINLLLRRSYFVLRFTNNSGWRKLFMKLKPDFHKIPV